MLRLLQLCFLVLMGAVFVLFAVWAHLTGRAAVLGVVAGATLGYLGLLSRILVGNDEAWISRTVDRFWSPLLGHAGRAAAMCGLAAAGVATAAALLAGLGGPRTVNVAIHAQTRPPLALRPEHGPVVIVAEIPNVPWERRVRVDPDGNTRIEIPAVAPETTLTLHAEHPAYVPQLLTTTVEDALRGVTLELEGRPALVVELRTQRETRASSVHVTSRLFGRPDPQETRSLGEDFTAIFIAGRDEFWQVELADTANGRFHRSPAISVGEVDKPYTVTDGDEWDPFDAADPPEPPAVAILSAEDATMRRAHGSAVQSGTANRFLYGGTPTDEPLIVREGYLLSYNPDLKIPNWVAYRIDDQPPLDVERPRFREDRSLPPEQRSSYHDYTRSGYDRGALASFSDMRRISSNAARESFLLSVVAPQTPALNRHAWLAIETLARDYVDRTHKWVCVVAGPAFLDRRGARQAGSREIFTLGASGVAVPTHFWRLHVRLEEGRPDVLAFLAPNGTELSSDPAVYLVSLGRIEAITGLRLFPDIPARDQPDRSAVPSAVWSVD